MDQNAQGQFRKGNRASLKHGTYGFLAIGSLPKGASYIRRMTGEFQRSLERCVCEQYGEVSVIHAMLCQSAARHEGIAQLSQRWLRDRVEAMSDADRLAYLRQIGTASDARDRCVKSLGLRSRPRIGDFDISAFYSTSPAAPPDAPADH